MRSWCWGRCRPQMVTSRLPWSSFLLEAPDCEAPRSHGRARGAQKSPLATVTIHSPISYITSVEFYKVNKIFVHIYVFLLWNKRENDGLLIFEDRLWPRLSKETNCVFTLQDWQIINAANIHQISLDLIILLSKNNLDSNINFSMLWK